MHVRLSKRRLQRVSEAFIKGIRELSGQTTVLYLVVVILPEEIYL
jgi:hypothetical protein